MFCTDNYGDMHFWEPLEIPGVQECAPSIWDSFVSDYAMKIDGKTLRHILIAFSYYKDGDNDMCEGIMECVDAGHDLYHDWTPIVKLERGEVIDV